MAAVTLSLWTPDARALATTAQEYVVPANCRTLTIKNRDTSIKIRWGYTGTDGGALSPYKEIEAGAEIAIPAYGTGSQSRNLDSATRRLYLASASGTPSAEVLAIP